MSADARDFCPDCDGRGWRIEGIVTLCSTCEGTGRFR